MSRTTHTPGPWYADIERVYGWPAKFTPNIPINPVILGQVINLPLAKIPRTGSESEANAQLIAAAPELLEALERLAAAYERLKPPGYPQADAEKLAYAAIAKATGAA